jgi:hypothetical protein
MIATGNDGRAPARALYFARIGRLGPVSYDHVPGSIGVFGTPTDREPIGVAHCTNWGDEGPALWQLIIDGAALPGAWIIVDREFIPAQARGQAPGRG